MNTKHPPWHSRSDGTVRHGARYDRLLANCILWIARLGKPPHAQSFKVKAGQAVIRDSPFTK
jgi:hypothetical protein